MRGSKRTRLVAAAALGVGLVLVAGAGAVNGHADYRAVCPGVAVQAAHCNAFVVTDAQGNPLASSSPPVGAYGPTEFHAAYGLPSGPSTQTVAIVDAYDDPNIASDLATYDSQFRLSCNSCFRKVNQTGGTRYPRANAGWALEISLDVETVHEICQTCKILLVEANSSSMADLGAAENEAANLGANVISNSYGGSEYSGETTDENRYFAHPGIAITVSSGDGGYGVEFPASSRYVTAVGGTTLALSAGGGYGGETAWSGSGSGCSAFIAKPTWQGDTGCSNRTVADVSADADPNTGAAVYDSVKYQGRAGWFQVGGTSLAAPLVAAVYALAGNAGTTDGSFPYTHTGSLHDVTSGSNGTCGSYLCTAGNGYDGPTGLGSPSGTGGF